MAVNYAAKFSPLVDEAFEKEALTNSIVNNAYDWTGVDTVNVYSIPTVELVDYTITGANRYGNPAELENNVQTMKLTQDKAFTFTIDKKSEQDTVGTMQAAAALGRQIRQVVIPTIDRYRLAKLDAGAPAAHVVVETVTKSNAYEEFLKVQEKLDDDLAPMGGRVVFVTPAFYNKIKLDSAFVKSGDLATRIAITGQVGAIDGLPVVNAPTSYFPENVDFIITNPIVMPSPIKLAEYKIHDDAPGLSGFLVEGRVRFDSFILNQKANAIGIHRSAARPSSTT